MSNWFKFSSVSKFKKQDNDVLVLRLNKDSAVSFFEQFKQASNCTKGVVVVVSVGKKGEQEHLNGAIMVREKQEQNEGFKKKFTPASYD